MVNDFSVGTLLAFGAAILFGVHTSFSKTKSVIGSGVAMPIYNIYFLIGAAITNLIEYVILLIMGATIEFTYLGIICAFLLLCFEVTLLLSIQQIGVGYATGFSVFSASIVTPILQVILKQPIAVWWIMVIGLLMLACSVFAMSVLRDVIKCCTKQSQVVPNGAPDVALQIEQHDNAEQVPLMDVNGAPNQIAAAPDQAQAMEISRCSMISGLVFSSFAGLFMAVLPLPSLYADDQSAGLNFFLSFGVGCIVVIPLSAVIAVFMLSFGEQDEDDKDTQGTVKGGEPTPSGAATRGRSRSVIPYHLVYKLVTFDNEIWHFKEVVLPAVSAGIIWGIGNICGFCSFLYLSYTIAISFVQCNVIVAMLLSIVLWKEITNKTEISIMFLLSLVLVAGCAVVVYGVFGSF